MRPWGNFCPTYTSSWRSVRSPSPGESRAFWTSCFLPSHLPSSVCISGFSRDGSTGNRNLKFPYLRFFSKNKVEWVGESITLASQDCCANHGKHQTLIQAQVCQPEVSASPGACDGAVVALGLLRLVSQPRCLCPHVAFISSVSLRRALVIECTVYRTLFPRDHGTYTKIQTILF